MSGSIQRVINELGAAGKNAAVLLCPECEGGSRRRRTLSVHLRDGVWLWCCHRPKCGERGALVASGEVRQRPVAAFVGHPLQWPLRLPNWIMHKDPIAEVVMTAAPMVSANDFGVRFGLRVNESDNSKWAWQVRNMAGNVLGWVTRDVSKNVLTWKEVDRPFYAVFRPDGSRDADMTVIVEDPLSAALLAEAGITGIAVLSDAMQTAVAQEIAGSYTGRAIFVCPDPDTAGILGARKTVRRLEDAGAERVFVWPIPCDIKNMTYTQRIAVVEGMVKYCG